ncbi:caspase family protein [uncultured Thiothrix sp.]|uniref:caspase family protein n=1 Tax=uncultured Thiothrix sp. TaxID=223185 RepID=UPI0026043001|nr:caspase family protein [uncultured Thiothrix sp.]HMT93142.1 caspase family protein [Thiolinea sp.]
MTIETPTTIINSAALVIGISQHSNTKWNLPANVANDARDFYKLLIDPKYCAFKAENTQLLIDQQASLANLRQAFKQLVQACNQNTTVVIYYSGHGGRLQAEDEGYLIPADVTENLESTALSSHEFSQFLQTLPARRVVTILDCCHAGSIGQLKYLPTRSFKTGLPARDLQTLAAGYGRLIIASSLDTEYSLVIPTDANSLFTKYLLQGLQGAAAASDGYVRIMDLFHYIQPKVKADSNGTQNPLFRAYVEENFALAFHANQTSDSKTEKAQTPQYPFDAFISYLNQGRDYDWVLDELVPLLESSGLKLTDSHAMPIAGATRISNMEAGFRISRRILLVMSDNYLQDNSAMFENVLFQDMGIHEGSWRVIPVYWENLDKNQIPARLKMLSGIDLTDPRRQEREKQRLLANLQ